MSVVILGRHGFVSSYLSSAIGAQAIDRYEVSRLFAGETKFPENTKAIIYSLVDYSNDEVIARRVNFELMRDVFRKIDNKISFVYLSSTDTLNLGATSIYLETKREAERYCSTQGVGILRLSYPIGTHLPQKRMLRRIYDKLQANEDIEIKDFPLRLVPLKEISDFILDTDFMFSEINLVYENSTKLSIVVEQMKMIVGSSSVVNVVSETREDPLAHEKFQLGYADYESMVSELTNCWLAQDV